MGACVGFEGIDPKTKLPIGGYHGDCAGTFPVGQVDEEARRLIVTEQSFWGGHQACPARQADLRHLPGRADLRAKPTGFGCREYVGHGVGRSDARGPEVPNYVMTRRLGAIRGWSKT